MSKVLLFISISFFALGIMTAKADVSVTSDDIETALVEEFSAQGVDDEIELEIFGGQTRFFVPQAKSFKLMVSNLKFDEMQNKFSAEVEVFADGKTAGKTSLMGKYYPVEEIYVPARNLDKGEVIQESDLKKIKVRSTRIKPNYVTSAEKLIGKEVKRALKVGKVISSKEVGEEILVHKNDKVNLQYKTDRMQITAVGVAQEDGAKGQKIEVENTHSHKKVFGTVIDANTLEVDFQ